MGRPPAEIARDALSAFAEQGARAAVPYLREDVVLREDPEWPDGDVWHGHDGVREMFRQRLESTAIEPDIEELRERGQRVLAIMRWTGRGLGSGATGEMRAGAVFTFEGSQIALIEMFIDPDRARARFDE
jgi:ketosteroid isomerase-like protein